MKVFKLRNGKIIVKTYLTIETSAQFISKDGMTTFRKVDENRVFLKNGVYTMFSNTADVKDFKRGIIKALECQKKQLQRKHKELTEEQNRICHLEENNEC